MKLDVGTGRPVVREGRVGRIVDKDNGNSRVLVITKRIMRCEHGPNMRFVGTESVKSRRKMMKVQKRAKSGHFWCVHVPLTH